MAGRIWIPPYKPLGVSTQAVPGGGYIRVDPSVAQFGGSILGGLGRQGADGDAGMASGLAKQLAGDNEAVVKTADVRLGEAEQVLLFDPENGYLNTQGQAALTKAPEALDAYREALDRELAETTDDDQHDMLRGLNVGRLADFTTQVERHSEVERQRWYDEAGDRRIAQMRAEAGLHWSDDAMLRRALGTTRFEVRDKAERKGWDSPLTEAALRQHTSRILVAAIEGAVERDPDRAQAVRTRYDQHIEAADRAALDALLAEAQTRRRADAAITEILNATPPDGEQPTPQWRLRQAEAIAEPAVRAATIRRVLRADAETQARARALAEQVLARVLKDGLTDPSQIPVREWVTLDAEHRRAIETRLDHNAAGTEPAPNPALVDELAAQMTKAPDIFVRRDLVPAVAHLPLPQWQRFRDWQAGLQRNDPATEDQLDAIKRGLQLANKMQLADMPDDEATNIRAGLVEDIATQRRITGKSPDDADIAGMLERHIVLLRFVPRTLERKDGPPDRSGPDVQLIQGDSNRFGGWPRLLPPQASFLARKLGYEKVQRHPIDAKGQDVYRNLQTGEYIKASRDPRTPGVWEKFDKDGKRVGIHDYSLRHRFPDPPPYVPFVPSPPAVPPPPVLPPRPNAGPTYLPARGLPPPGILPPVQYPAGLRVGPASRPSDAAKGGMSFYERSGAEWRWYPGDKRHHPHWDYNSHRTPNSQWHNIPHGGMMDHMKVR